MKQSSNGALNENLQSAAEKTTEMAKLFAEKSAQQFEASLNAGKAIFDSISKQYLNGNDKTSHPSGFIKDGIENTLQATNKWFRDAGKSMSELYEKQVHFLLNTYSEFMESANELMHHGKDSKFGAGSFHNSVDIFVKNMEESSAITKKMFASIIDRIGGDSDKGFIKDISELMQATYAKQTEQLIKLNKNLLVAENLKQTINLNKEVSEKLQNDLEKNFEASKKIIKSIFENYTKEANFSTQTGKKMLDEIFAELDIVTNNNIKFWTNWFDEVYREARQGGNTGASKNQAERGKAKKNG